MRATILLFLAAVCIFDTNAQGIFGPIIGGVGNTIGNFFSQDPCSRDHLSDFQSALSAFSTDLFKRAAKKSGSHFVISPLSIWLPLAALAEGADDATKLEYFRVLNLPGLLCQREEFYRIAMNVEAPGTDVNLRRKRLLILDSTMKLKDQWSNFVNRFNLLEITKEAASQTAKTTLNGTSSLQDYLDYEGRWTTAFPDSKIERATFYDDDGEQNGLVDLMRMTARVKLAHLPILNAKVLELPVGNNGRYSMLIAMGLGSQTAKRLLQLYQNSIILDILNSLILSPIPINIAIPQFNVYTQYDARTILEEIGLKSVWNNPAATRYVSEPAAMPSNFIQRVNIKIGTDGVNPPPRDVPGSLLGTLLAAPSQAATQFVSLLGRDFIANKPFLYSLIDTKTKTILFTGSFSKGQYPI